MQKETPYQDFILNIIKLYQSARDTKFSHDKINRGRSHSISSFTEDLFAEFLAENIECDEIYIDQPISIDGVKGVSYPDIVVVRKKVVIGTCDLKMDMGWNREGLFDLCEKSFNAVKSMRGKCGKANVPDGLDKKELRFTVSSDYFHNIVIISDQNSGKIKLEEQRNKTLLFNPSVNVFILTSKEHLNSYRVEAKDLLNKVVINEDEFSALLKTFNTKK